MSKGALRAYHAVWLASQRCRAGAIPINQLKLEKWLIDEFGFSDRQAEGIPTAVTEAEEKGITSKYLDLLEARLRKLIWRQAIVVVSILGALIAALEFVAGGGRSGAMQPAAAAPIKKTVLSPRKALLYEPRFFTSVDHAR